MVVISYGSVFQVAPLTVVFRVVPFMVVTSYGSVFQVVPLTGSVFQVVPFMVVTFLRVVCSKLYLLW